MNSADKIKSQILEALSHAEAEEGLYFENLGQVHEDEERVEVEGDEVDILDALQELIQAKKVVVDDSGEKPIFMLAR